MLLGIEDGDAMKNERKKVGQDKEARETKWKLREKGRQMKKKQGQNYDKEHRIEKLQKKTCGCMCVSRGNNDYISVQDSKHKQN